MRDCVEIEWQEIDKRDKDIPKYLRVLSIGNTAKNPKKSRVVELKIRLSPEVLI